MAFEIKNNVLLSYREEKDEKDEKDVVIPEGVTGLGGWVGNTEYYYAFYKCKYIESITIPVSVTMLDPGQFYYIKNRAGLNTKAKLKHMNDSYNDILHIPYDSIPKVLMLEMESTVPAISLLGMI